MKIFNEQPVRLIQNHNALVKSIRSPFDNDRYWSFFIEQVKDPVHYRPVKELADDINRKKIWDYQKQEWRHRQTWAVRGRAKTTRFTKKTATSLLPVNGKMDFYRHADEPCLGVILDIEACYLKGEKYIFSANINSDNKPWLFPDVNGRGRMNDKFTSLKEIRDYQRQLPAEASAEQNEVLAAVAKKAIVGIFFTESTQSHRLAALHKQALLYRELILDVPILHLGEAVIKYSVPQIRNDIQAGLALPESHQDHQFARYYMDTFPEKVTFIAKAEQVSIQGPKSPQEIIRYGSLNAILELLSQRELDRLAETLKITTLASRTSHGTWGSAEKYYYDKPIKSLSMSSLLIMGLYNEKSCIKHFIEQDPSIVTQLLLELREIRMLFDDYYNKHSFKWHSFGGNPIQPMMADQLAKTLLEYLFTMPQSNIELNKLEKRQLVSVIKIRIQATHSLDELVSLRDEIERNEYLNQRRNPKLDSLRQRFFTEAPTKATQSLLAAIEEKIARFSAQNQYAIQ